MLASRPVLAVTFFFYNFFSTGNFWSNIWLQRFYHISRLWANPLDLPREHLVWSDLGVFDVFSFFVFCMQESAKAALNMKGCQMTDRATQTEHAGPEVRHRENPDTFLALSETQKGIAHEHFLKECLNIRYIFAHYLTELTYPKTVI